MGNNSDILKHSNEECLTRNTHFKNYVEFHSGFGIDPEPPHYEGSSIKMIKLLDKLNRNDVKVYLHEEKEKIRETLRGSVLIANPGNLEVEIREKWQDNVEDYIKNANEDWLFLIDPTSPGNYTEKNGILDNSHLSRLIGTQADIFMYFPEYPLQEARKGTISRIVLRIYQAIKDNNRDGIDLSFPIESSSGWQERVDHNIIVSTKGALKKVSKNHLTVGNSLLKNKKVSVYKI